MSDISNHTIINFLREKKMVFRSVMLFLPVLFLAAGQVVAQPTTDEQLAVHYFQNGEYGKAAIYYEKLYNKKPNNFYYNYYLKSLVQLENYKSAEKLVKRQIKKYPGTLNYLVDLGNVYDKLGERHKARQQYDKAIKNLRPKQNTVIQLAKSFMEIGETRLALETYRKGRKLLKGYYPFNNEIAEIYGIMGDYEAMINEYLELLSINNAYLQSVQNSLNRNMSFEKGSPQNQVLKAQLLKRIQKSPGKAIYSEMLIWLYIQQKDFEGALVQAKALDRRQKETGERLVALARLCTSNRHYDIAIKCYQYVIDKGEASFHYINSRIDLLNVMNKKITTGHYTSEELLKLEQHYYSAIDELGKSSGTVRLLKELAHLQAFYLHRTDSAVTLLEEAIGIPRIKPQVQAQCKLELGDILVIRNEIWDASLLYSQVDKAYKYDQLGEQAKFRNAKIAYYTGDFNWAKAQLNVLKGSTSKLIANDALDLSLLITDNTGIDTSTIPMLMYARADLLAVQHKYRQALATLDSINAIYPGHALEDEVLFQRYRINMKRQDYKEAATYLQKIITGYSWDLLGDDALFKLAQLHEQRFNEPEKAKALYRQLMTDFPGSLYVVDARKRFRQLRGDTLPGNEKIEN